jgi:DNA-directed RNA polymerase subunit H (RpoH/RPB5)
MDILFEKYENIKKFILEYRNYKMEGEFLDFNTFKKAMQIEQYIYHKCIDIKKGRNVYIYLFMYNSKYIKTTPQFKRLMDKIPEEPLDIIIITKLELSVYIKKALLKYTHLKIFNYMHKYFSIEISKGPLCSKHIILSNNEVKDLCSRELIIHPLSLPSISINDPQNIWIGGELGEVIKILSISEITGETIRYRIVSPDSGKMINIQKLKKSIQDNDDAQILEDESNNTNAVNQQTEQSNKNLNNSSENTSDEKNKDTKEDLSEYIDDISDDEGSDYD